MCVMIGYVIRVYMAGCHATRLLYFQYYSIRYLESTYVTHIKESGIKVNKSCLRAFHDHIVNCSKVIMKTEEAFRQHIICLVQKWYHQCSFGFL